MHRLSKVLTYNNRLLSSTFSKSTQKLSTSKPVRANNYSNSNLNPTTIKLDKFYTRTMSTKGNPYDAKIDSIEKLPQGNWIQTRKINYTDPNGNKRVWEMAIRTTRTETTNIDAVSIAAFINFHKDNKKSREIVLTKQFRPPCGNVVIELPAGLIDPKESIESTAIRELIEETGYYGKFVRLSDSEAQLYSDPGLTNANMAMAFVEIDINDERNQNPKPQLEDGEFIETFTLPLDNLLTGLLKVVQKENCVIDARLYHLAAGIEIVNSNKDLITS